MLSNRKRFSSELIDLNNKVLDMGNEVIESFKNLINACEINNQDMAKEIIENDQMINDIEISINVDGYLLIARQCPVASDLRRIITALKISNDLERIADYSVNIAKYMLKTKHDNSMVVKSIMFLGKHLIEMLEDIMEAFEKEDIELALKVNDRDEILDDVYKEEVKELIKIGKTSTDEESEEAIKGLLVIKQIERAGDHITNIAENIVYLVNGKRVELN
jgi:phosphate transport system protein